MEAAAGTSTDDACPCILVINCSGIERLGSLAAPLARCDVTEITTHDAVQTLKAPVSDSVQLVRALPVDDSGFDGLIVMGGPFSVRTASSDEGEVHHTVDTASAVCSLAGLYSVRHSNLVVHLDRAQRQTTSSRIASS